MRNNSFRTRLTTGTFTLPFMAGLTVLLWMLPDFTNLKLGIGLGFVALTTFFLAELNNLNALIRTRSRMVEVCFLAAFLSCSGIQAWSTSMIPMMCLVLSYFQLFSTYQKTRPEGNVFFGFLFLGIASYFYPPLLCCAVILYLCLLIPLRALTWRTFFAGIFGMIVPFWVYTAWAIWNEKLPTAFDFFIKAFSFESANYAAVPGDIKIWFFFSLVIIVCSILHYSYTAYNDKIRTRMYYYVIISIEIFFIAAFLFQPQSYPILAGLLCVNSAPLIAHYFTLGKGRIIDYWFIIIFVLWGTLTIFNTIDLWTLL